MTLPDIKRSVFFESPKTQSLSDVLPSISWLFGASQGSVGNVSETVNGIERITLLIIRESAVKNVNIFFIS